MTPDPSSSLLWRGWPARLVHHLILLNRERLSVWHCPLVLMYNDLALHTTSQMAEIHNKLSLCWLDGSLQAGSSHKLHPFVCEIVYGILSGSQSLHAHFSKFNAIPRKHMDAYLNNRKELWTSNQVQHEAYWTPLHVKENQFLHLVTTFQIHSHFRSSYSVILLTIRPGKKKIVSQAWPHQFLAAGPFFFQLSGCGN